MLSLFGILILTRFSKKIFSNFYYFLISIIIIVLLILTESRTAIFALIGSYFISFFSDAFFNKRSNKYNFLLFWIVAFTPILIFFLLYGLFVLNTIFHFEILDNIFSKSGRSDHVDTFFSTYFESRGQLITDSLNNIDKNFWSGIGFGIASDYENMKIYKDYYFNIPYSAPIEKGMFYAALYEEIGFFGYIFFLFFIFTCIFSMMQSGLRSFPILVIIFLINIAESTFYSTGGAGGLLLIFFTLSITRKSYIKLKH